MKFTDLLLCLTTVGRGGESFRDSFAGHAAGKPELRIMSGVVGFGAMVGRLAAASNGGGNGPRPKIAQSENLLQELGATGFQGQEGIGTF